MIVGGVVLVSNWRTQRAATAAIQAAQHGPMTDRWVSAVKLLASAGAPDRSSGQQGIEARLGAIYLIEQIAKESSVYRVAALELLAAYVREHSQIGRTSLEPTTDIQWCSRCWDGAVAMASTCVAWCSGARTWKVPAWLRRT